jgi:1,4-alpha-glucan branching enzyme
LELTENTSGSSDGGEDAVTTSSSATTVSREDVAGIVGGRHRDPFSVLGPHSARSAAGPALAIRAFVPGAREGWVVEEGQTHPLTLIDKSGFFEAVLPGREGIGKYRLRFRSSEGLIFEVDDAYAFPTVLSDYDLYLLGEGTHYKNYQLLGAHLREIDGVSGVSFAVWAPNAQRVSVVGDFNFWDGRRHPMRFHPGVGVWDIFIPGLKEGDVYKFELLGPDSQLLPLKSDPYGFYFELRPNTAGIVHDINRYTWRDEVWMRDRKRHNSLDAAVSVYEVHLGSWIRSPDNPEKMLGYRELAHKLVDYCIQMGFTHIELMPVTEHPFDGSWGYQTLGYFAPTSRFGTPEDFMYFVDYCHQHEIGVLIDWVPAHFPRDDHGLRLFDGSALYEHADPRQGEHPEWGTMVFNYGRNEVANFLLGNALFWFDKYHIDGVRVDAVASMLYLDYGRKYGEWIPNRYGGHENLEAISFLKRFNELVHLHFPGVMTVAEESTAWGGVSRPTYLGGLGFSMKWNMGWMNDTLRYFHKDPLYRRYHQNDITFSIIYAFTENFMLPLSHDEVVHGKGALLDKMPGDFHQRFANLRLLYAYMFTHPGKKLLFMGGEFGQWQEWRYWQSLDWHLISYEPHQGVQRLVRDLNHLIRKEPALFELDFDHRGFEWIDHHDADSSVLAYLRRSKDGDFVVIAINFTPVPRPSYSLGVPAPGQYRELINTDSSYYGGSNLGNDGEVTAIEKEQHGRPFSISVTLPPLSVVVFKRKDEG